MANKLAMRDFLTFRPKEVLDNKKNLFECQDEKSPTGSSLLVRLEATHSGIVNGNARFYRPDRMQASSHVWTMPGRPLKPVLVRHDEQSDPLGRVIQAKYVDLSYKYADEYPIIKDTIFYNTDAKKRVNLYDSVDWIVDHLMPLDDYRGLGYIELGAKITHPDAIRKVLNDEYLTVSVGFETDQAICSICHTDWAVDDRCEHKMGTKVDKKLGYLIAGNFDYHEVSFINFPADPFAATLSKGTLLDSLNQIFFMGLSLKDQARTVTHCHDSLESQGMNYTADIQVLTPEESKSLEGDQMTDTKVDTTVTPPVPEPPKVDLAKLLDEVNAVEPVKTRVLEIRDLLKDYKPEGSKDTKLHKRLVSTVNAVIRKFGWDKSTPDKADVERKIATLGDVLRDMSKEARVNYIAQIVDQAKTVGIEFTAPNLDEVDPQPEWKLDELPEEDKGYFSDPDKIYEDILAEMATAVTDGELTLTAEQLTDAKLSGAARKKLKSGTFCGPGRSFPVPDCAHVTAARRLIGRASVSSSTKSKILACVSRKASSLGCGGKKDESTTPEVNLIDQLVSAKLLDEWVQSDVTKGQSPKVTPAFVDHLKGLNVEYGKSDPDMHYWMCDAVCATAEHWKTGQTLKYHQKYLAENAKDFVILPVNEHTSLQDAVNSIEDEMTKIQASSDSWQRMSLTLVESLKESKATQIVMYRMLTGVQGYQGLTLDQFNEKVKELAKRTRESLEDTLEDVTNQLNGFVPPTKNKDGEKPIEVARDVKDSIILDPPVAPEKSDKVDVSTPIAPDPLLGILDPKKRRIMETYYRVSKPSAQTS